MTAQATQRRLHAFIEHAEAMHRTLLIVFLAIWSCVAIPVHGLTRAIGMPAATAASGEMAGHDPAVLHHAAHLQHDHSHPCCPEQDTPDCPDGAVHQAGCHGTCSTGVNALVPAHPVTHQFLPVNYFAGTAPPGAPAPAHRSNPLRPPA